MPTDYGNQNSSTPRAYYPPEGEINEPSVNPFRISNAGGNHSYSYTQSPFGNAHTHADASATPPAPPTNSGSLLDPALSASPQGSELSAAYQGYGTPQAGYPEQAFAPVQLEGANINPIPSPGSPTGTWSQEFDGFTRISQQSSLNERRAVLDIYNDEQLRLHDRQQFSELHFLLQTELRKRPDDAKALIGVALCNLALGEPTKAAEYFSKAIDIDEAIRPAKFLNELPTADPDDWLDMAEELGHCGILEGSMEVCSTMVESNQFSDRVRRQAQKVREAIRQDYFAARERIVMGNAPKSKEKIGPSHLVNALIFVVVPLALAIILGCVTFYSFDISNGKTELGHAIYRLEHLKRGDTAVERMGSCDQALSDAMEYFTNAARVNPFSKEAHFYKLQTAYLMKELGRVRIDTDRQWDAERWQTAKADYLDAENAYNELSLPTETDEAFKAEWKEFYKESMSEANSSV